MHIIHGFYGQQSVHRLLRNTAAQTSILENKIKCLHNSLKTETGAMHLLTADWASECQVYGVAPMSLFVDKGRLETLSWPLIGPWLGYWPLIGWDGTQSAAGVMVSVSPDRGPGVLWNLEIIREESAVQCHLTVDNSGKINILSENYQWG